MSVAPAKTADVINRILGADEGGRIATLRNQKPNLADELQDYYLALFEPEAVSAGAFQLVDRYLIAIRVASHTRSADVVDWYAVLAAESGVDAETLSRVRDVAIPCTDHTPLGAAIRHADLVTTAPARAEASHLQALKDAGYSPAGILSLAQTIAFVSYQLRLIAGLRALGATS
jgi:uncharacterized protein YciW